MIDLVKQYIKLHSNITAHCKKILELERLQNDNISYTDIDFDDLIEYTINDDGNVDILYRYVLDLSSIFSKTISYDVFMISDEELDKKIIQTKKDIDKKYQLALKEIAEKEEYSRIERELKKELDDKNTYKILYNKYNGINPNDLV